MYDHGEKKNINAQRYHDKRAYYAALKRQKEQAEKREWERHLAGRRFYDKVEADPETGVKPKHSPAWINHRKLLKSSLIKNLRGFEIPAGNIALAENVVAFDLEFTGYVDDDIMEIGAVKLHRATAEVDVFHKLIRPRHRMNPFVRKMTGLTFNDLRHQADLRSVLPHFFDFIGTNALVVGHGIAENDLVALNMALDRFQGQRNLPHSFAPQYIDTVHLAMQLLPKETPKFNLHFLSELFSCVPDEDHRALTDAATSLVLLHRLLAYGKLGADALWSDAMGKYVEHGLRKIK